MSSTFGDSQIRMFADDAKLYSTDPVNLQSSLNNLGYWLKNRQLKLATDKCFSLHISKSYSKHSPCLQIYDTNLSTTSNIKDLGIYISENLSCLHIWLIYIYRNACNSLFLVTRFSKSKNIWILLKLYKIYVRPKLEFSTPIWSPFLKNDITKIQKIQKRFTKFACQKCNIPFSF